jgi:hypothetical protein
MWWTYVISKGMFEPHVSWPRAWSFVFQSPVPSLDPLFTGGCSRLRHAHLRRTSRIRPTLTQHHARTGPSLSLTERVPPLCGYLPHHLVEPLLFGSVPHRPSPRHCLDASHSGRPSSQRTPIFTADARLTKTVRLNRLSVHSLGRLFELTVARRRARWQSNPQDPWTRAAAAGAAWTARPHAVPQRRRAVVARRAWALDGRPEA